MSWNAEFFAVAKAILPFAEAAATALVGAGAHWVLKHTQNSLIDWAVSKGQTLMDQLVIAENQVAVNALKKAGKWDQTTAARTKQAVLDQWQQQSGQVVQTILAKASGDVAALLSTWLEKSVALAPNKT